MRHWKIVERGEATWEIWEIFPDEANKCVLVAMTNASWQFNSFHLARRFQLF
jgi:hypothetical protein